MLLLKIRHIFFKKVFSNAEVREFPQAKKNLKFKKSCGIFFYIMINLSVMILKKNV